MGNKISHWVEAAVIAVPGCQILNFELTDRDGSIGGVFALTLYALQVAVFHALRSWF
jgi:hypothetical protein